MNHQSIVDQIVRSRIYSNIYWKEQLAGVNAEELIDRMLAVKYVGGTYGGNRKPTKFLCIILKLLQMAPDKKIVFTLIENENYKYIRLIGLFYLRLTGQPEEVYTACEKFVVDYRKAIVREHDGSFRLTHVDELIDEMLRSEILFDIALPRLPKRAVLEDTGKLESKRSILEEEIDKMISLEDKAALLGRSRSRSGEKESKRRDGESDGEASERRKEKKQKKLKKIMKQQRKRDREVDK